MFLRNILGYNIFSSVLNQPQFILPLGWETEVYTHIKRVQFFFFFYILIVNSSSEKSILYLSWFSYGVNIDLTLRILLLNNLMKLSCYSETQGHSRFVEPEEPVSIFRTCHGPRSFPV
jgi:hypothetical protein